MVSAPAAADMVLPVMSPGNYLRLRRQAAQLTIAAVARATVSSPVAIDAAIEALANAEADRELLGEADLERVARAFPLVPAIYSRLIDGELAYGICRSCGCSESDACPGRCAWADRDETFCTSCLELRA